MSFAFGEINSKAINSRVPINGGFQVSTEVIWTEFYDGAEYLDLNIYLAANDGDYATLFVGPGPETICLGPGPQPLYVVAPRRSLLVPCRNRTMIVPPFVREDS